VQTIADEEILVAQYEKSSWTTVDSPDFRRNNPAQWPANERRNASTGGDLSAR
jgi:hypothetical protein